MKNFLLTILCFFAVIKISFAQKKAAIDIKKQFEIAAKQYEGMLATHADTTQFPQSTKPDGSMNNRKSNWWCSGFFGGSLWYLFEFTGDKKWKDAAHKWTMAVQNEKNNTKTHDLGFMMYCSFGTAYKYTNNPAYKDVVAIAAKSLSTRYRPQIKSIQSWNSRDILKCPVIIDNMMNLELLHWVSDHGGDPVFKEIAVTHANTTIANQFRPDNSSVHVVDWDLNTGTVLKKITWQGAADSSAWSRGQTWGFYGYTMMYRFTKNKTYLEQAKKIARFLLSHPRLPSDKVPYWDFDAPGIPNVPRDASSAAIMASALLELGQYTTGAEKKEYIETAETILQSLSSPAYRAKLGENGGFILMHSVGSLPHKSEVDAPLTYADYYFIEGLTRYKDWYLK